MYESDCVAVKVFDQITRPNQISDSVTTDCSVSISPIATAKNMPERVKKKKEVRPKK